MTTGRVTAAPTIVRFSNGKDYLFSPLSDKDFDILDEWLQARYVENGVKGLPATWSEAKLNVVINSIVKASMSITFLSADGLALMSTVAGMTMVAWLSLRREQPELSQDEVRALLLEDLNLKAVNLAFQKVNAVPVNPTMRRPLRIRHPLKKRKR